MKVIIVGGGRVGYYLIRALLEHKHELTVIELDSELCHRIANEMDIPVIQGDATRYETLAAANTQNADAFISVTGSDENNLIACQIAKNEFGVKKTVAKSNNPKNVAAMKALGLENVINSTDSIASLIEREVDVSKIKELLQFNKGEGRIFEVTIPENYVFDGKMLMEIKFPETINIVSITRGGSLLIPRGQSMLKSGDKLLIITGSEAYKEIRSILKIKE